MIMHALIEQQKIKYCHDATKQEILEHLLFYPHIQRLLIDPSYDLKWEE